LQLPDFIWLKKGVPAFLQAIAGMVLFAQPVLHASAQRHAHKMVTGPVLVITETRGYYLNSKLFKVLLFRR